MKIKLFKPYITGNESKYIHDILDNRMDMSGDGKYTKLVHSFLEKRYGTKRALLTTSGTSALELAIRLLNLKPGDEVIAPSFTFSSTINAILLAQGVKVVFAEIEKQTLNIDAKDIERKITKKTKAIMVVHYAGVACDMDKIMTIAKKHNLKVVEDAAQAIEAKYKDKYLGTIGDFGCFSFHDTKNITCGEGGALFINNEEDNAVERAEIIREKGTNRSKFFRGEVDKYTWVDVGSSYLPSDILAAYLLAQLESVEKITRLRQKNYDFYAREVGRFAHKKLLDIPTIPDYAGHNAHIFYIIMPSAQDRNFVMDFMRTNEISATFHYIPLHSAPQGRKLGNVASDLPITEEYAERLLRLPLYSSMTSIERKTVVKVLGEALEQLKIEKNSAKEIPTVIKQKSGIWRPFLSPMSVFFTTVKSFII